MARILSQKMVLTPNGPQTGLEIMPIHQQPGQPAPAVCIVVWHDGVRMTIVLEEEEAIVSGIKLVQEITKAALAWKASPIACVGSLEASGRSPRRS